MKEILIDAVIDSLKIFVFIFVFNIIISFIESKVASLIEKKGRLAPFLGSLFGVIPQCGVSVVAADLFSKRHITIGTLIAIFISCSDEALPILFSKYENIGLVFLLLGIKIVVGSFCGFLVDLIFKKEREEVIDHHSHCEGEEEIHIGCCNHQIEENESKTFVSKHIIHSFVHALKITGYVLIINIIFGLTIYFIGEDKILSFLNANIVFTPIISLLIGIVPNCASSVLLANAYIGGIIPFSALLCGLCINAGLGMITLLKNKKDRKYILLIFLVTAFVSLILGYGLLFI